MLFIFFDSCNAQHNANFAAARTFHKQTFAQTAFTQALLLNSPAFKQKRFYKTWFYTNAVFTQALSLHKPCFYTSPAFTQKRFYTRPAFTQTLSLHKLCLYTSTAFTQGLLLHKNVQKRFYTRPPFTQTLSLHKLCLYTYIAFIQALLLHNDICSHTPSATCKQATGWMADGMPKAVKYVLLYTVIIVITALLAVSWYQSQTPFWGRTKASQNSAM